MTSRSGATAIVLSSLVVLAGCTARQRLTRAVKSSQGSVAAGDEFLIAGRSDKALEKYRKARTILSDWEAAELKPNDPLFRAGESVLEELDLRISAFESPEGAATAAVKLAGTDYEPNLAEVFWNHTALVEKAFPAEKEDVLSRSVRPKMDEFAALLVNTYVLGNRELIDKIEPDFSGSEARGETIVLSGVWRFGQTKTEISFEMERKGDIWTVVDLRVAMLGASLSEIFSRGVRYASGVRPLEEILAREDASETLTEAFEMAYRDTAAEDRGTRRTVSLVMDATFRTDDGYERQVGANEMVELLGESRVVDGEHEVLVKTLDYVSDEEMEKGAAPPTVGWIPQEALPSTGEETLWGTG